MNSASDKKFLEFKKTVLDSKSPSFCGAKWLHSSIFLASGFTSSCHIPTPHQIDLGLLPSDPSALHNTEHKKRTRQMMLAGEFPKECDHCWKVEKTDPNLVSERVLKSMQFSKSDLHDAFQDKTKLSSKVVSLEIGFERTCQMACSYCSASHSSVWSQDITRDGPYLHLASEGGIQFSHDGNHLFKFKDENNPYFKAFWDWWPTLKKTLKTLRITGGEPLLSNHFWKLCELVIDESPNHFENFCVNSNLMSSDHLIQKLKSYSHLISNMDLYTSGEACGNQAEYIRHGLTYAVWKNNLSDLALNGRFRRIKIMMTVCALSLFSLVEFLNEMLELKKRFTPQKIQISTNILRIPSFQSILILPDTLKSGFANDIHFWIEKNIDFLNLAEVSELNTLVGYLNRAQPTFVDSIPNLRKDFKAFYQQFDSRRKLNIQQTFGKNFAEWYSGL